MAECIIMRSGGSGQEFTFTSGGLFQYPEDVEIPNTVTSFTANVGGLYQHSEIKTVTFEAGSNLTAISPSAFYGCTNLESVSNIPDTVTKIDSSAFYNCSKLKSFTFGNAANMEIGQSAFMNCYALSALTFKNANTRLTIQQNAFKDCHSLTDDIVEEMFSHWLSIYNGIFMNCTGLRELSITATWGNMFNGCTGLKKVTVTGNWSGGNMGDNAFTGCTNLETVIFTGSPTQLGQYYFSGCTKLKSVNIPNTITTIGNSCFQNCSSLQSVELPATITSFGNYVFTGCSALTDIILGEGWNCAANFSGASNLTAESMEAMFENLATIDGSTKTLTLGSTNLARLTAEQRAIATSKNWTLA